MAVVDADLVPVGFLVAIAVLHAVQPLRDPVQAVRTTDSAIYHLALASAAYCLAAGAHP